MSARTSKTAAAPPPADDIELQLATLVDVAPESEAWLHEIKLDGYRIAARVEQGTAQLLTRRSNDWTARFAKVARAIEALPVKSAVFDGEVVSLQASGRSDFQSLQNALSEQRSGSLYYYVFDLLFLDGLDLRPLPLLERKAALAAVLEEAKGNTQVRLSDHVLGGGKAFFEQACKLNLEGIIAKRAEAPYHPGRNKDWLKIKCIARQEFVIGGYTLPAGARTHLGALLVGVRDGQRLRYAGKVGTGFTQKSLRELHGKLKPIERSETPFSDHPKGAAFRAARWVEPTLVAEVSFSEFTSDGRLRHPSFQGLREDKPASVVVRERPQKSPAPAGAPPAGAKKKKASARKSTK